MKTRLRSTLAAAMLLAPVAATFVAEPAAAQQRAVVAAPQVADMTLNSDAGLSPGARLRVQVRATPNARRANVVLGDSGISVPLRQQTRGTYTGSYTVRRNDHIDATQLMTARVQFGDRWYSRQFNFPPAFQALSMGAAPAQQDTIERFVMRPMGRLEAGRELRFRLVGKPGGDAWMDIPGVIRGIDLTEVRPGVYEGNYTIRRRDNLNAFDNAIATLKHGDQSATQRVDVGGGDREFGGPARDERAPLISDMTPGNGDRITERNNTRISAHLSDEGSGIDPQSVRLRLNGRDVTADARVNDDRVVFRGDLDPGRYTAELTVRDRAGNTARRNWSFDVAAERQAARAPALQPVPVPVPVPVAPLALQVTSHANEMVVNAKRPITIHGRTAPHATVRVSLRPFPANDTNVSEQTVRADANGNFSALLPPLHLTHTNLRVDVLVTSTLANGATVEQRLKMRHSG